MASKRSMYEYDEYLNTFGFFNEDEQFIMHQTELTKFFLKNKPLYINRMQHLGQYKRIKHVDTSCTFKPTISKTTEQLAL